MCIQINLEQPVSARLFPFVICDDKFLFCGLAGGMQRSFCSLTFCMLAAQIHCSQSRTSWETVVTFQLGSRDAAAALHEHILVCCDLWPFLISWLPSQLLRQWTLVSTHRVTSAAWTICFNKLHEARVRCSTSLLRHKCWTRQHSDELLLAAITERSFSDTPGHNNTVRSTCLLSHQHSGLAQEEEEGNNPHKQYKLAGFLPAASMLALQRDLITTESSLMFHQVNCRALSDLGSHLPDRGGGGRVHWQCKVETKVFIHLFDLLSRLEQREEEKLKKWKNLAFNSKE